MKNRILIAALAALTLFSGIAFAESCVGIKPIAWRYINSSGNVSQTVDVKSLAALGADTTTWVWLADAFVPSTKTTATDSIAIGQFVVSIDSSAAYTPPQTSLSVTVEGIWGGRVSDANTVLLNTFSLNPTTGEKTITIPVYLTGQRTAMHLNQLNRVPNYVRMRFQSSAVMNACRVSFQYLKPCFSQTIAP